MDTLEVIDIISEDTTIDKIIGMFTNIALQGELTNEQLRNDFSRLFYYVRIKYHEGVIRKIKDGLYSEVESINILIDKIITRCKKIKFNEYTSKKIDQSFDSLITRLDKLQVSLDRCIKNSGEEPGYFSGYEEELREYISYASDEKEKQEKNLKLLKKNKESLIAFEKQVSEAQNNVVDQNKYPNDSKKKLSDNLLNNLKTASNLLEKVVKVYEEAVAASISKPQSDNGHPDAQLQEENLGQQNQSSQEPVVYIKAQITSIESAKAWKDYTEENIVYIAKLALFFRTIKYDNTADFYCGFKLNKIKLSII